MHRVGDGCSAPSRWPEGAWAAVALRGNCTFAEKERVAAAAGAALLLVASNETAFAMAGEDTTTIPAVMVDAKAGRAVLAAEVTGDAGFLRLVYLL